MGRVSVGQGQYRGRNGSLSCQEREGWQDDRQVK